MTKSEIIIMLSERTGQTQKVIGEVVDSLTDLIAETLAETGEKVNIAGFGTFEVRIRQARQGKLPRTGETITIPETKVVAFRAGSRLKAVVK